MPTLEILRVIVFASSLAGIGICVFAAYKYPTRWGYAIPPILWLINLAAFSLVRGILAHETGYVLANLTVAQSTNFNLWGQSILLQGAFTIALIGGYYLWKPR